MALPIVANQPEEIQKDFVKTTETTFPDIKNPRQPMHQRRHTKNTSAHPRLLTQQVRTKMRIQGKFSVSSIFMSRRKRG
jgi:hypothetical protein